MKKLMLIVICSVMCIVLISCNANKKIRDNQNNNANQKQSYHKKDDGKKNTDSKFYSAQFMSMNNDQLEVIIMKEVDGTYDFSAAGEIEAAKEFDPNEKEEEDTKSPFSIYKITPEVILKNSNGDKLNLNSLSIGDTILIKIKDDKLISVTAE